MILRMKYLVLATVFLGTAFGGAAMEREVITLWPERSEIEKEDVQPDRGDGVIRLTNIANPSLHVYPAPKADAPVPAVLVCPGGGYVKLAYNKEGTEVAEWLNSIGIAAAVLKYRVPGDREGALEDVQRAMGLLRFHGARWNVDPGRIGVLGFSAGGHLAARLSTTNESRVYEGIDDADGTSCRPDFTVLIYPAYIARKDYKVASKIAVNVKTPPAFILQTQDDTHYINSSIAYYIALKDAGIPAELHVYPIGGHGYGMRPSSDAVSGWPALCARWLKTSGIVK
jgi:acetyl esterase/lipase